MPPWREPRLQKLYEKVVKEALPETKLSRVRLNTQGYLNVVFEVNDDIIFRFPRSERAAKLLAREIDLLPWLARSLSVSIPEPFVVGSLPGRKGWPFMGYAKVSGVGLAWGELTSHQRAILTQDLGPVLTELARIPWQRAQRLGVPGGDAQAWQEEMTELYESLRRYGFPVIPDRPRSQIDERFRDFLDKEENFRFRPVLLHGEIHSSHVLWDQGRVSGLIDWGFASIGDPAREFASWAAHFGTLNVPQLLKGRIARTDRTFMDRVAFNRFMVPIWRIRNTAQVGDLAGARQGVSWLRRALRIPPSQGWST